MAKSGTRRRAGASRPRGTRGRFRAPKRTQMAPYLEETMLILKTSLETDVVLRALVQAALRKGVAAPSWAGRSLPQFLDFFRQWMVAPINIMNPGANISQFSVLIQTAEGQKLASYPAFEQWLSVFFENRHEYLGSPETKEWLPYLATATPPGGKGFNMQMMPADKDGSAGPSMEGTAYQKSLIKKLALSNKLIVRNGTPTLDLPPEEMKNLFSFSSFNQFFLRRFLPGTRPLASPPSWMRAGNRKRIDVQTAIVAPADGMMKWLFHEQNGADVTRRFMIKDQVYSLHEAFSVCTLGKKPVCDANRYLENFAGGPMIDTLLWFTDYHHFHAPVSGKVLVVQDFGLADVVGPGSGFGPAGMPVEDQAWGRQQWKKQSGAEEASPMTRWSERLSKHRRQVYVIDTDVHRGSHVGLVMMMPIGFYGVGSMVSLLKVGQFIRKGEPAGHFAFGGSSCVLAFEPGRVDINLPYEESKYPYPITSSKFMHVKVREAIGAKS